MLFRSFQAYLGASGMLSPQEMDQLSKSQALDSVLGQMAFSGIKTAMPGSRITNMELDAYKKTIGNLSQTEDKLRFMNDFGIAQNNRQQNYAAFLQNYQGNPGQAYQSWMASPQGSASVFQDPNLVKHMPQIRGKAGTAAEGMTGYRIPNGNIVDANGNIIAGK